ncbi:MAG: NAD(P)H-hydrate dehydratase [Candidatus Desulforudis sp.]|nr:NAD(P)H-hydrate dehydratase [Desulforudis sp.]
MRVVTAAEMREMDRCATAEYAIPSLVLMENAGLKVYECVRAVLGDPAGKLVVVLIGKGNNGGDGLVAARHLFQHGARVKVILDGDAGAVTGDAGANLEIWRRLGQRLYLLQDRNAIQVLQIALMQADVVVDGLYGTGFKGEIRDRARRAVEAVNESGKPVVAIDIPSGVEADTGAVRGAAIRADHTVCFGLPKVGLVLEPGAGRVGKLHVVDISLPRPLLEDEGGRHLLTGSLVRSWLPLRGRETHKGAYGHVLVVAGARGMLGAACLAAQAAAKSGAGLVTLAVPRSLQEAAAGFRAELMTMGLPETGAGTLSRAAREQIEDFLGRAAVLALGPGLSTHSETVELVRELLPGVRVPSVLDADGLNAAPENPAEWFRAGREEGGPPLVITPHPGEMARLMGVRAVEIQADRLGAAEWAAGAWNCTVALKGARTLVAAPGGTTYINPTGNPGMATGGTGDVLTGMVAGLLAQGLAPERAAGAAVFLHGRAGDLAAAEHGQVSMLAGDVLEKITAAFLDVEG